MAHNTSVLEAQFDIEGASSLFRKTRLMQKVAEKVALIDKAKAYRIGIGPHEYDAIIESRVSSVDGKRLESIFAQLTTEPG